MGLIPFDYRPLRDLLIYLIVAAIGLLIVLHARGDEPHTAGRVQPFQRLAWQWVPPQRACVGGRCFEIPGHHHQRFQPCRICGDRTRQTVPPSHQPSTVPLTPLPRQFTSPANASPPPTSPAQDQSSVEPGQLSEELATIRDELAAGRSQIEQLRGDAAELLDKAVGNTAAVAALAEIVEGVQDSRHAPSVSADAPSVSADAPSVDWLTIAKYAAMAVGAGTGVTLPWWAIVAARAGGRLLTRRKRGRATINGGSPQRPPVDPLQPFVITTESPPPPQHVAESQSYVPYEADSYRRAHVKAREQLAKRYPSSVDMLEFEQSLIDQYLSAQSKDAQS